MPVTFNALDHLTSLRINLGEWVNGIIATSASLVAQSAAIPLDSALDQGSVACSPFGRVGYVV